MSLFCADQIKQLLFMVIDSLREQPDVFLSNPKTDFTRSKKISFRQTMLYPMVAGNDNGETEMVKFFGEKAPFNSAMIQRRKQIKIEAFMELFYRFNNSFKNIKTLSGYQLVACDGSRLNLPYNPSDPETFIHCIKDRRGINQMHLNCLYDLLNDYFLDVELQGIHQMDEKGAFCNLVHNQLVSKPVHKQIFMADRGYASYNNFAHMIHNNQLFLIRVPEAFAEAICKSCEDWLATDRADEVIIVHIGRCNTKKHRQLENYHNIPSKGHYDFIEAGSDETDRLLLRVLKFPLSEGNYEYVVTNLPEYAFSAATIKKLYHLRWGEETAFRHLKYAGNMVHLHSTIKDFLIQEIYAKLTMYNFSAFLTAAVNKMQSNAEKHRYVINHSQAQKSCILFLRGEIEDIRSLLRRYLVPVRPGRKFERNLRRQSADTLTYR